VPTKELRPSVEAKTSEAQKASEHETIKETVARQNLSAARLISQPGGFPLPRIQPTCRNRPDSSQPSLPAHYILQLQRRYGNRFVQRVLNSGRRVEANEAATSGFYIRDLNTGRLVERHPYTGRAGSGAPIAATRDLIVAQVIGGIDIIYRTTGTVQNVPEAILDVSGLQVAKLDNNNLTAIMSLDSADLKELKEDR